MRVSMTVESDGVTTEVIREYESDETDLRSSSGERITQTDEPALPNVTRAVALAAATAHYPKEN